MNNIMSKVRKTFNALMCSILITLSSCGNNNIISIKEPSRPDGQTDVLELRCEPIDTVRVAFIGLGNRGVMAVDRFCYLPTTKIAVLCDVQPAYVQRSQDILKEHNISPALEFTQKDDWRKICAMPDIDLVYVCTDWVLHAPIAVEALNNGKHVAVEVPIATTLDECWQIVEAAERNRRHCMMLENCNYDFFELATLNMAQKGLLGELVHAEGAYIHDLRELSFDSTYYWNMWRLKENSIKKGNLYPTHGLGPIAHAMNIHRGDKMNYLVCVATDQFGLTAYAKEKYGEQSSQALQNYAHGDMSTTLIRTEKGKTMLIQHDVVSPRPYDRHHILSGTKGFVQKYPIEGIALEPNAHEFLSENQLDSLLQEYEHPIVTEVGEQAKSVGGHGGMDFIMDYRLIYCLNNGLPLDQDVYDAVEWSSLVPLTQLSLLHNGMPVEIPDFTRGAWNKLSTVTYYQ